MKKAMMILILAAMLTACGNMENTVKEEKAETSAVSQSTTTATLRKKVCKKSANCDKIELIS